MIKFVHFSSKTNNNKKNIVLLFVTVSLKKKIRQSIRQNAIFKDFSRLSTLVRIRVT